MKYKVERVTVSAVVHSTEDMEKVGEAIAELFPFEFEIGVSRVRGHFGNEMAFLEVELKKKKEIEEFLKHVFNRLKESGELEFLKETLEERVDEGNVLHLRFDKQKAYMGELTLGGEDSIAVKVKVVTYPAKKESAVKAVEEMIEKLTGE